MNELEKTFVIKLVIKEDDDGEGINVAISRKAAGMWNPYELYGVLSRTLQHIDDEIKKMDPSRVEKQTSNIFKGGNGFMN